MLILHDQIVTQGLKTETSFQISRVREKLLNLHLSVFERIFYELKDRFFLEFSINLVWCYFS